MLDLYYLVLWIDYLKKKNTWEPLAVVMHLWKLINTFYKEYLEKPMAISLLLDSTLLIARSIVPKKQLIKEAEIRISR